jgi:hypothetical protein
MLTLRLLEPPDFTKLTPVQKNQFEFIESYTGNLQQSLELMEFFSVHDAKGKHVYDMHLFCGDDGQVFEASTNKRVASFSQGGSTCDDKALEGALDAALAAFRAAKKKKKTKG